jgi:hypothetical protein
MDSLQKAHEKNALSLECLSLMSGKFSGRGLCGADHSSRGVLWTVECSLCDLETSRMKQPWPALGCCAREKKT